MLGLFSEMVGLCSSLRGMYLKKSWIVALPFAQVVRYLHDFAMLPLFTTPFQPRTITKYNRSCCWSNT